MAAPTRLGQIDSLRLNGPGGGRRGGPPLDHGASLPCRAVPMMIAKNPAAIKRGPPPRLELLGPDGGRRAGPGARFPRVNSPPRFAWPPTLCPFDNLHDFIFIYCDLLDSLHWRETLLMGFSMGGWAAAEIAVMNIRRFSKLVLVDSVGIKPGGRFDRDIADVLAISPAEHIRISWHDASKAPDISVMTDEELQILAANRIAHGLYTWEPYMHNPKLPYRLHRIDIPTLLIWGQNDGVVTTSYAEAFRDMIPGAKMVVIPEACHAPHVEQPEAFVKRFLEFASS